MEDIFRFADELGPAKVIHVYEPSVGLKAVLVVDNVARGPAIGGLRIAPDVSTEECFRLVLEEAASRAILPCEAAVDLAVQRLKKSMNYRRWSLFSSAPGFV